MAQTIHTGSISCISPLFYEEGYDSSSQFLLQQATAQSVSMVYTQFITLTFRVQNVQKQNVSVDYLQLL